MVRNDTDRPGQGNEVSEGVGGMLVLERVEKIGRGVAGDPAKDGVDGFECRETETSSQIPCRSL